MCQTCSAATVCWPVSAVTTDGPCSLYFNRGRGRLDRWTAHFQVYFRIVLADLGAIDYQPEYDLSLALARIERSCQCSEWSLAVHASACSRVYFLT